MDVIDGMILLAQRKDKFPSSVLFGLGARSGARRRKERGQEFVSPSADGDIERARLISKARSNPGDRLALDKEAAQSLVEPVFGKAWVSKVAGRIDRNIRVMGQLILI